MQTIILPVVLYGCKTGEGHRLRVFEKRVLRRIFRPKREKMAGGWRNLHSKKLNHFYSSPNIVRVDNSKRVRWAAHVGNME
jgi:hypothetical protein